ncbi:hypothetical protein ACLKA6_018694 [Drosophila palustris]
MKRVETVKKCFDAWALVTCSMTARDLTEKVKACAFGALPLEKGTDAVIISEQYGEARSGTWLQDDTGIVRQSGFYPVEVSRLLTADKEMGSCGLRAANTGYARYLTPSDAIGFETKLDSIEDCARGIGDPLVIAGDFNARAVEWGSNSTDSRGRRILDFASRLGLVVANSGTSTTFRASVRMATTPDITLVSERLAGALRNWTVLEDYTGSDHQYIEYSIELTSRPEPSNIRRGTPERPQVLLDTYNACLVEGKFPAVWKQQKLTLISKGKGNPERGRSVPTTVHARHVRAGGLSPRQHGFRPGHSTLGAIHDVIDTVSTAQRGNHYSRKIVLLATLDVRNAFNSVNWSDIVNTLEFSDRVLLYDTSDGSRQLAITSGAAQGSILGPDLWNDTYDSILEMRMPDDTHLVAFADDVAAVIVSRDTTEAQRKLNVVMVQVQAWLRDHGLKLAAEKWSFSS